MTQGKLTVQHLQRFRADAKKHGNLSNVISPMVLPSYTRKVS
jgi:succinate dehydrogenase / fumarate reductase flavoprotein subunit/L-aspartate oxidase